MLREKKLPIVGEKLVIVGDNSIWTKTAPAPPSKHGWVDNRAETTLLSIFNPFVESSSTSFRGIPHSCEVDLGCPLVGFSKFGVFQPMAVEGTEDAA